MGYEGEITAADEIASALAWWAEAGVDVLVDERPRNWLARAAPAAAPVADAPDTPALPATLDSFVAWRMTAAEVPEASWGAPRVAPAGDLKAALMVLVDQPAGAALLGDAEARLLERMLAAIALDVAAVHIAPAWWAEPLVKPAAADRARLDDLARHHVALAAPKAVLALGDAASRALTATNMVEARGRLHAFNHEGASVSVVASRHPRFLLKRPQDKAQSWADLLLLKGVLAS